MKFFGRVGSFGYILGLIKIQEQFFPLFHHLEIGHFKHYIQTKRVADDTFWMARPSDNEA